MLTTKQLSIGSADVNNSLSSHERRRSLWKLLYATLIAVFAEVIASIVVQSLWSQQLYAQSQLAGTITCAAVKLFDIHNKTVNDASTVTVEIRNVGARSVAERDFQYPLTLSLEADTSILNVDQFKSQPELMKPGYRIGVTSGSEFLPTMLGNVIEFQSVMLNKGDFYTYRIVVDKPRPSPKLQGHIADVELLIDVDSSCQ